MVGQDIDQDDIDSVIQVLRSDFFNSRSKNNRIRKKFFQILQFKL